MSLVHGKLRKDKIFLFVLILISLCNSGFAQTKHYSNNKIGVEIFYKNSDFKFKNKDNARTQISIKNHSFVHEEAMPLLPTKYQLIYIPENYEFSLSYQVKNSKVFKDIKLEKSHPQHIDTYGFDNDIIENSADYPIVDKWFFENCVEIVSEIEYRGHKTALVRISPVQYNPLKKEVKINYHIEYNINFTKKINSDNSKSDNSEQTIQFLKKWVQNPEQLNLVEPERNVENNYLIITHPDFASAADTLALWKQQCGFKTKILSSNFWDSETIKHSIQELYDSLPTRPNYLCILGDHEQVPGILLTSPPPLINNYASDVAYACMGGDDDIFPDIPYGRISVSNEIEAMNVVRKIVNSEKKPPNADSFYNTATHCGYFQDENFDGYDDRRFVQTLEEIKDYVEAYSPISVNRIYQAEADVNPQFWNNGLYSSGEEIPVDLQKPNFMWDGNTSDIINAFNHVSLYVIHRDHGYSDASGWTHPHFGSSEIEYLFNNNNPNLVFSINCHSGEFYKDESFAEKLLRSNAGAWGVFAPSFYSYSGYNDAFLMGLIDGLWVSPSFTPNFTGNGHEPYGQIDEFNTGNRLGNALINALLYKTLYWGLNEYSMSVMHFFGDPSMQFHKVKPATMSAFLSDTLDCSSGVYKGYIPNCNNCIASLIKDGELIAQHKLINDSINLFFEPQYGDSATLSVYSENWLTLEKNLVWNCSEAIFKPQADFSSDNNIECNNSIQFHDLSSDMPETWEWHFGDGNISYEQNPIHQYNQEGDFTVKLIAGNSIGSDTIIKENFIKSYSAQIPNISDTILCFPNSLTLFSDSVKLIHWFYDINKEDPIELSLGLHFDYLDTNLTLFPYHSNNYIANAGKPDNEGIGGMMASNKKHYLVFKTKEDMVLKNVKIYSGANGNKIFELSDSVGNILQTKIVNISEGENIINLNFQLEKDRRYRLMGPAFANLFTNTEIVDFPYSTDYISIDSSSAPNKTDIYYYFYNWEVERKCYSQNHELNIQVNNVQTEISPSGTMMLCNDETIEISAAHPDIIWNNGSAENPIYVNNNGVYFAHFHENNCHYYTDTLFLIAYDNIIGDFTFTCNNNICNFISESQNAFSFYWDFGDGNFSDTENPQHVYEETGEYLIKLKLCNNCDTILIEKNILIESVGISENENKISVYPNPFKDEIIIDFANADNSLIQIFDICGKLIYSQKTSQNKNKIDTREFSSGVYFVIING